MVLQWIGYLKQSDWLDLLETGVIASIISSVITLGWNGVRHSHSSRSQFGRDATAHSLVANANPARPQTGRRVTTGWPDPRIRDAFCIFIPVRQCARNRSILCEPASG